MVRQIGTVKFFSGQKGYGFIVVPNERDVFLHVEDMVAAKLRWVEEGDTISFDVEQIHLKGPRAKNIKLEVLGIKLNGQS